MQEPWEIELEDALAKASPQEVLTILRKIKGWVHGYCVTCGTWNNTHGGGARHNCNCQYKGEWNE